MMNKFIRIVVVDNQTMLNALSDELSNDNLHRWIVSLANDVEAISHNYLVEAKFAVTSNPKAYKDTIVSNNIIDSTNKDPLKISKELHWIMKDLKSNQKVFFTSDTHFQHKNIINYCSRPWMSGVDELGNACATDEDVIKMDEDLINKWNSTVSDNDIVYHLGDFALGNRENIAKIRSKLNGKIHLVLGNHDFFHMNSKYGCKDVVDFFYKAGFDKVYDKPILFENYFVLSHEPMMFLNSNCPFVNVYGHVHDSTAFTTFSKNSCCVCVERHDYKPISFDFLKTELSSL